MLYPQAKADYDSRIAYQSGKYEGCALENNTRLVKRDRSGVECYAIKLHRTDVVTLFPNGLVMLRTGGWETTTTKNRINKYAPTDSYYAISQSDYIWYVHGRDSVPRWSEANSEYDEQGKFLGTYGNNPVFINNGKIIEMDASGAPGRVDTEAA